MKKNNSFLFNYLKPNCFVESFQQIDVLALKKNNIKLIVCDLDNTLAPHFNKFPINQAIEFCQKIKDNGIIFVLASNNMKKRVNGFANILKPDKVIWNSKKPLLHKIKKTIKEYKVKPEQTLFIGDQFLIDIVCANRYGAKSILVFPLTNVKYQTQKNKVLQILENAIYKKISLNNINMVKLDNKSLDSYEII